MQRTISLLVLISLFITGCGVHSSPAAAPEPASSPVAIAPDTPTASPEYPATDTAIQLTLASFPTATITPTSTPLPELRTTPATLMLHKSSTAFNSVAFLREFIGILKENDIQVVTYQYISEHPEITATAHGKLAIITIDDIYLDYGFSASIKEMVDLLCEANYPAVLGIITEGYYPDKNLVSQLKSLSDRGWEIASHSDQHENLGVMEKSAPRYIYTEIKNSQDKIESAIGIRPITLILPEGQMTDDSTQIKRAGIIWVAGINGGTIYNVNKSYYYVGRESPAGNAQVTFNNMMQRFYP